MRHINSRLKGSFFMLSLFILLFSGCENDPASLGIDVLPPSDVIFAAIDSQRIVSVTMSPEEILSDGYSKNARAFLGRYYDPKMGMTKADFIAELNIATPVDSFDADGINYYPDSAVLNLYYHNNGWYGNKFSKLDIKVYELTERLDTDLPYLSNYSIDGKYKPEWIGEKIITPYAGKNDSVWTVHKSDTISIKLSEEFTQRLFELRNISAENKEERDKFKDIINGIYVTINDELDDNTSGALLNIDILNSLSNVTLHYKKEIFDMTSEQVVGIRSLNYRFPISRSGRVFNRFEHNLSEDVEIEGKESERLFIQGLAGTYVKLDLSDVYKQWKDSARIALENNVNLEISGVDFTFYVDSIRSNFEKTLYMPVETRLNILSKNEDGKFTEPSYKDGDVEYGAFYSAGIAEYNALKNNFQFSMKKDYFTYIINNDIEEEAFYLKLPSTPFNYKRMVLFNNDPILHPKVKIRYVKF